MRKGVRRARPPQWGAALKATEPRPSGSGQYILKATEPRPSGSGRYIRFLTRCSARVRAASAHVDGVNRLAGGHEQAVAFGAAETHVGADFGQQDRADTFAAGREHVHAVIARANPALPSRQGTLPVCPTSPTSIPSTRRDLQFPPPPAAAAPHQGSSPATAPPASH